MSLRQRLNDELKQAMKAGEKLKVSTLRLVNAAIKERDIESRTAGPDSGVGDAQIIEVLNRMIKQRQDSLAAFEQAGRQDLAEQERGEIAIIRSFMPEPLGEAETAAAIEAAVAATGASTMKDMGKVMAHLKERYAGRMDFGRVGAAVKAKLQG
ncbi:MAG TPA: GatB/YqeY domain-containing protein [Aestuariivirgaceae bacterium]|jgi:uncharacterized protein YqeY|nr:GatB/YqeY domain-containing protein [Aestuariivirgaceae bacterium]